MKINLFSKALLMSGMLAMVACSNDEPVIDNGNNNNPADGNTAYMSVVIKSANKMSRATTTPGYEDGEDSENFVEHIRFFFFDKDGAAMDLTAYLAKVDESGIIVDRDPTGNIEAEIKNNILVLENMKSKEYPSYMITIINDDTFQCGYNLTSTLDLLANYKMDGNFVMSTSSYTDKDRTFYNATAISADNFQNTPTDAVNSANAVVVYVERLAAKVKVEVNAKATKNVTYNGESFDIFELTESVANGNEDGTTGDNTEGGAAGESPVLNTKLYLRVLGWALNTTANQSYMCKNIDPTWNYTWKDASWNNAADFRSYWAKAYTYGDDAAAIAPKVSYRPTEDFTKDNLTQKIGDIAYCNENTNLAKNIYTVQEGSNRMLVDSRVATNVVLRTQIVEEDGTPIDMVFANGVLFRKNAYLKYILNRAYSGNGALNLWTKTTNGDDVTYTQIGTEYFDLVYPGTTDSKGLGHVNVAFNSDKLTAASETFYKKTTGADGNVVYEELGVTELATIIGGIQDRLDAVQPSGDNHAVIYDNGNNIYYIPIEHLAAEDELSEDEVDGNGLVEGYYGVVRNHYYRLSINSFSKVGHGMWEPGKYEEQTKPEKPEDPLYYLGAHINILSWKVVDQGVEL